jgi:hypothetical protein
MDADGSPLRGGSPLRPPLVIKRREKDRQKNAWWAGNRTMLNPHGSVRIGWDFLMCVFLSYIVFSEPVFMGFDVKPEGFFFVMEHAVSAYFLADIVLNFRTAFESGANKAIVTNARAVALRYLCSWFIIDFASSFPFHLFFEEEDLSATKNVKVIKSTKFYKVRGFSNSTVYGEYFGRHPLSDSVGHKGDEDRAAPSTLQVGAY